MPGNVSLGRILNGFGLTVMIIPALRKICTVLSRTQTKDLAKKTGAISKPKLAGQLLVTHFFLFHAAKKEATLRVASFTIGIL